MAIQNTRILLLLLFPRHASATGFPARAPFQRGEAGRERGHDGVAIIRRHHDPSGDFIARTSTAETIAGLYVDRAYENAG
ncbi:hypothetical protein QFZ34_004654 [Phyllobacterium ifriqiyense]|uniref:Uncharacterized protein n=1 Tax=Phyllobacterium ifriqiyense TaxID=314238 RepID=A0ABU0SFJ5_9HYPH|nr:hypothetical protein [Phyllobacterium ifriqiyense]